MVKRIRTLLTLFLLLMGTTMSWAAFKDFEINLVTKSAPALPEGVTQISYPSYGVDYRNDDSHGTAWYAIQFDVDGPVKISLGGCRFTNAGYEGYVTDGSGTKLGDIPNKTTNCYHQDGSCGTYEYKGGATTLKVYCGQYCPYVKVEKLDVAPETQPYGFQIDLMQKDPTLPEGVTATDDGAHGPYFNGSHGWANYVFKFTTNKSVKITMKTCYYGANACVKDAVKGNVLGTLETKTATCGGEVSWTYTSDGTAKDLYVHCGDYCHGVKVEEIETASAFENFKIDFRSDPYTVLLPGTKTLPACVTVDPGTYYDAQHGTQNAKITVKVDGPVLFTIGGCGYGSNATVSVDGGAVEQIKTKDAGCDNTGVGSTYAKNATYRYNSKTPATLTFDLGSYCPYFFAEKCELIEKVKVSYYNTDGKLIGEEEVDGNSKLTYKYGVSNVTVPSGQKFRGWFDGTTETAKKVAEGTALTNDAKLYAKATPIEVATTTSAHFYDLRKNYWYQEDHELIEISGGQFHDGQHGWDVASGSTVKLQVAGDAIVTVNKCFYASSSANMTLTDASNKVIGESVNAKTANDGEEVSFKYTGGATTLTLTYSDVAYIHTISVEHVTPVAFEPFKVDFRDDPYSVIAPESGKLPACATINAGTYKDAQHGAMNATVTVQVDRPVKFTIGGCFYTNKATVSVDGGAAIDIATKTDACDGGVGSYSKFATYTYKGTEAAVLKFTLGGYCPYFFAEEASGLVYDEDTKTYMVASGNVAQLKEAIEEANATGDVTIYLPNGTYDLGQAYNTEIKGKNIAIIGESRDGVIIKNTPAVEGLGTTATLYNRSTGLYLQDLTLQCSVKYSSTEQAERGVALWDKGTQTICKNVYLKGKQDTYYSNGAEGMKAYFEGGKIEGTVDFICGSGNVLFNSVNLIVTTSDQVKSGGIIAAPSTYTSENGYVFANCLVTGAASQNGTYYLARGWKAHGDAAPAAIFVGTNMAITPNSSFWSANIGDVTNRRFAAYGTTATKDSGAAGITKASLINFAGSWNVIKIISEHNPIKTNAAGWASYTAFTDVHLSNDATAYVAVKVNANSVTLESINNNDIPAGTGVFIKGDANASYNVSACMSAATPEVNKIKPVIFDTALKSASKAYVLGTKNGTPGLYKVTSNLSVPAGKAYLDATGVSTALAKDALELVIGEDEATGISTVNVEVEDAALHNVAGQKVGKNYKGIVVKNGKAFLVK